MPPVKGTMIWYYNMYNEYLNKMRPWHGHQGCVTFHNRWKTDSQVAFEMAWTPPLNSWLCTPRNKLMIMFDCSYNFIHLVHAVPAESKISPIISWTFFSTENNETVHGSDIHSPVYSYPSLCGKNSVSYIKGLGHLHGLITTKSWEPIDFHLQLSISWELVDFLKCDFVISFHNIFTPVHRLQEAFWERSAMTTKSTCLHDKNEWSYRSNLLHVHVLLWSIAAWIELLPWRLYVPKKPSFWIF